MVIDFSDLKSIVKKEVIGNFDHSIIFNQNTPHIELAKTLKSQGHKVLLVNYQPTSEGMIIDIANKISNALPENIKLHSLKLQETDTSFSEWFAADN